MILYLYAFTVIKDDSSFKCKVSLNISLVILMPIAILLTVILLFTTCCPSFSSSCCCCPPLEFGIFLPSYPRKVFVRDQTQPNGRREIKEEVRADEVNKEGEDKEMMDDEMRERNEEDKV